METSIARRGARMLRVLCLHGMYQSGQVFALKTHGLREHDEELAEYVFVDAPFRVTPPILMGSQQRRGHSQSKNAQQQDASKPCRTHSHQAALHADRFRAWWRPTLGADDDHAMMEEDRTVLVDFLQRQLCEIGDVDGVVGFSQGATLASWLCTTQAYKELSWSPKFVVLVGGYMGPPQFSLDSGIMKDIDSLHIFGSNDYVVSADKSQQVLEHFEAAEAHPSQTHALIHNQGHVVPKSLDARNAYHNLLLHHHAPAMRHVNGT